MLGHGRLFKVAGALPLDKINRIALATFVSLIAINFLLLLVHVCVMQLPGEVLANKTVRELLDLHGEANVPTWYATILWLLVGQIALATYFVERTIGGTRFQWFWLIIAAVFFAASCDEMTCIHEIIGMGLYAANRTSTASQSQDALTQAGAAIFYVPVLAVFFVALMLFLWGRFRTVKLARLALCTSLLFFGLSIGCDFHQVLARRSVSMSSRQELQIYNFSLVTEEVLENLGALFFMFAIGRYMLITCGRNEHDLPKPETEAS
jgi:hypothetical protein